MSISKSNNVLTPHAVRSHTPGRSAHHSGWSEIAWTPRWRMRYATSWRRGSAVEMLPPGPVQKSSADDAARGQTMSSRFSGPDCSVQRRCWPPRTSEASSAVRFAVGLKL